MSGRLNMTSIFGGIFYLLGGLVLLNVALGLLLLLMGAGPDYNLVEKFGQGCLYIYVGTVHSRLRRAEERLPADPWSRHGAPR